MHEGDLLDWLSVAAVAAAALAAVLHAVRVPAQRAGVTLLAASLAFLALDDAFGIHERVTTAAAGLLGVGSRGDVLFLLPYLPLMTAVVVTLWRTSRAPGLGRPLLRGALSLLALAVALRIARAGITGTGIALEGWQRTLGNAVMHDTELVAWIAVAAGLLLAQTARISARKPSSATDEPISST